MKAKIVYLAVALALVFALAAAIVPASPEVSAHSGDVINSNWTATPPTIDGTLSAGEWDDATVVTVGTSTAYVKNDGTNLYLATLVPDGTMDLLGDFVVALVDADHDGVLTQGNEDGGWIAPGILGPPNSLDYTDLWWDPAGSPFLPPMPPVSLDSTLHGSADWTHDGANYYFEASKPLNSGDGQDMSASPGDTVGLVLINFEATSISRGGWPTGFNSTDATTWGDLVLATQPTEEGGCFIATAAYGSYLDSNVDTLRDFRDQYLVTNPVGSALVSAYYKLSPPVAEFIDDNPALKPVVRAALMPAVALSTVAVNTTLAEKIAMVSGLALVSLALGIWLRRRAARKMTY